MPKSKETFSKLFFLKVKFLFQKFFVSSNFLSRTEIAIISSYLNVLLCPGNLRFRTSRFLLQGVRRNLHFSLTAPGLNPVSLTNHASSFSDDESFQYLYKINSITIGILNIVMLELFDKR